MSLVVVLDPFMVALGVSGPTMVTLDFSMVALGLSGFLCGLQFLPWWPWVSVNPPMLALEPAGFCPGGPGALRDDSVSYSGPQSPLLRPDGDLRGCGRASIHDLLCPPCAQRAARLSCQAGEF